jgi:hypothetical protein
LGFVGEQFFIVENSEVIPRWPSQQKILIGGGDEYDRKVEGKPLRLISLIDLPFLATHTETADS